MSYYPTKRSFAVSRGRGSMVSAAFEDKIDVFKCYRREETQALVWLVWILFVQACGDVFAGHPSAALSGAHGNRGNAAFDLFECDRFDVGTYDRLRFRFVLWIFTAGGRVVSEVEEHRVVASHS